MTLSSKSLDSGSAWTLLINTHGGANMKQSFNFAIEAVTVQAGKFPVTIKGVNINAECEYNAEEMQAEGSVFCQAIDQISQKLSWLKPLIEKELQINIRNKEMLSKDLERQISEGTCRAYGPNGWSVRTSDLHDHKCDKKH